MAKIMISIPDKFLEVVDEHANLEQSTRSEFIRTACREYIRDEYGKASALPKERH